jgi:hypothetical protein
MYYELQLTKACMSADEFIIIVKRNEDACQ